MELVNYELQVPKESKEVIDLLAVIFDKAKDGFEVSEFGDITGELIQAISGLDQVDDEFKGKNKDDLLAYLVKQIGSRLE